MLLTRSKLIKKGKSNSWNDWFKRRLIRIYPSLILTTLIVILFRFLAFQEIFRLNSILIHVSGLQAIPTNPNFLIIMAPHWFITFILSCYVFFPFIFYFLNRNFKWTVRVGVGIYLIFIIFGIAFYNAVDFFFSELVHTEFNSDFFRGYFPSYFTFFFGMIWGYKLNEETLIQTHSFNLKKTKQKSLVLMTSLSLLSIILYDFFGISFFSYSFLYTVIIFPIITVSSIIFAVIFLENKSKTNHCLNLIGNHSYEIFLIHLIPIFTLSLINIELELYFLYLFVVIISSLAISHPFYYVGVYLRNKTITHNIIAIVALGLIAYAVITYIF